VLPSAACAFLTPTLLPSWWADALTAVPRVVVGALLAADFGWSKFPTPEWFVEDVAALGFPAPTFFAWAAVLSEVVGGALLALGLLTRCAGLAVMVTMLVAAFLQKAGDPMWERLPALGCAWVAIYAVALGSGRYGLDALLFRARGGTRR
jgi:putative oxidoreductase